MDTILKIYSNASTTVHARMQWFALLMVVITAATACDVLCARPAAYWRAHPEHPAWAAADGQTLLGATWANVIDGDTTILADAWEMTDAQNIVAAALSSAMFNCSLMETSVAESVYIILNAFATGSFDVAEDPVDASTYLAAWVAGELADSGGPCHCSSLDCARVVAPQIVIDRLVVATDKLSSASVGFLVWAIVATVIAAVLALVAGWLSMRRRVVSSPGAHTLLVEQDDARSPATAVPVAAVTDVQL